MLKDVYKNFIYYKREFAKNMKYILATYFNKQIRDILFKIGFFVLLGWLVFENRSLIGGADKIDDIKELLEVIQTPTNLLVFKFGIIYTLAAAVYFLVRLPLLKIEQLKVPGLEYKVEVENTAKVADENFEAQRKKEEARLGIINTIAAPNIGKKVTSFVTKTEINMTGIVNLLSEIIQAYLLSALDIKVKATVVGVVNGMPTDEFDKLNINAQLLINEMIESEERWKVFDGRRSILAVSYRWDKSTEDYCVQCLDVESSVWKFSKADYLMLEAAWNILRKSYVLRSGHRRAIIVTEGQAVNGGGDCQ